MERPPIFHKMNKFHVQRRKGSKSPLTRDIMGRIEEELGDCDDNEMIDNQNQLPKREKISMVGTLLMMRLYMMLVS